MDPRYQAIRDGNLTLLQQLQAQQPSRPWPGALGIMAVRKGHLPILQWLRSQNLHCPWDGQISDWAAFKGHWHMLQWLLEQPSPCPRGTWTRNHTHRGRPDQYAVRRRLADRHGLHWAEQLTQWLKTVQDMLEGHLPTFLCHDVLTLVQCYV